MRIVELNDKTKNNLLENLLKRSPGSYGQYEQTVNEIISEVREKKDEALFAYTLKFDRCAITPDTVKVTEEEIKEAYETTDPEFVAVMKKAAANITKFHEKQRHNSWFAPEDDGTILGQKITPLKGRESMCPEVKRLILPASL